MKNVCKDVFGIIGNFDIQKYLDHPGRTGIEASSTK
jgi:hypothetical protein